MVVQPAGMHLAQLNVGRARFATDDPRMGEFMGALDSVNALAERSPGFVWRLQSEAGNAQYQSNTMSDAIGQFFQTLQLAHNFSPARLDTSLIWHVSLRQILTVTGVMEPSRKSNALAVSLDSGD